jgi:hypothetical protein
MAKRFKVALEEGWIGRARARVAGFVAGTVRNAVDEVLDGLIRHGIRFGIAAAALITAVVLAVGAARDGIAALGVHPALASAGLGLVLALAGYLLFKSGPRRPRRKAQSQPGLSIRISRPGRPRRFRVYDVHRARDGWEVTGRGRRTFSSKRAAVRAAERAAARKEGSRVVIRRSDGSVQHTERIGDGDDDRR